MPRRSAAWRRSTAGLLAAAVTACAPTATEPAGTGSPAAGPSASSSATPGSATNMPAPLLVELRTTGGFAGVQRELRLYEDGTYTVSTPDAPRETGRLGAADLHRIQRLLEQARLGEQPQRSVSPDAADRFQYRITYEDHVVHRDETTLREPLRKALSLLPGA